MRPTFAATAQTCVTEADWYGRYAAAARVLQEMPNVIVNFSSDGAASITRLDFSMAGRWAGAAPTKPAHMDAHGAKYTLKQPEPLAGAARPSRGVYDTDRILQPTELVLIKRRWRGRWEGGRFSWW